MFKLTFEKGRLIHRAIFRFKVHIILVKICFEILDNLGQIYSEEGNQDILVEPQKAYCIYFASSLFCSKIALPTCHLNVFHTGVRIEI